MDLLTLAEQERALIQDAFAGHADAQAPRQDAKRQLLALAVNALRLGQPLSAGLRAFLADALMSVQCAVDAGPGQAATPAQALAAFGYEPHPPHRKAREEDEALLQASEIVAAVHVLAGLAGGKTNAVLLTAAALAMDEATVWRKIRRMSWPASTEAALEVAAPLLARLALEVRRNPLACSQELRDFLPVPRKP